MRPGSGYIERVGPTWYLRIRLKQFNRETGEISKRQTRIELGAKPTMRSAAAARSAADRWLVCQSPETLVPGFSVTVCEYLAHFVATHVALMRKSSQRRYCSVINHHLAKEFEGELLERVDARRIQGYVSRLAPAKARETVRSIISILLQVLVQARRDGFAVHRLERQAIKLPKASAVSGPRRNVTDKELELLVAQSPSPWSVLWAVMGYAGLRISEALGLVWANVDLDTGLIRVRQQAVLGHLQLPKTFTSQADVPILPELDHVLRAYQLVWVPNEAGLLWVSRRGTPLRADNVRDRQLHPTLRTLGLARAGLHAFRHGLPARLDAIGVSPGVVQKCMRHASLEQTEAYLHVGNDDVRAAIDAAKARGARPASLDSP